jgi:hypothetical protein
MPFSEFQEITLSPNPIPTGVIDHPDAGRHTIDPRGRLALYRAEIQEEGAVLLVSKPVDGKSLDGRDPILDSVPSRVEVIHDRLRSVEDLG